jgi:hypothetical protein
VPVALAEKLVQVNIASTLKDIAAVPSETATLSCDVITSLLELGSQNGV